MRCTWLVGILFFAALRAPAETINLQFEDIPRFVREQNQHAQGADLLKQSAAEGRGHLTRSYLPKLTANIGAEKFKTGTQVERSEPLGSLSAKMNVFRGGKDQLENEVANTRAKVASLDSDRVVGEEIRKARAAYWNLISQREVARLIEETTEENQKNLLSAQGRIRAGAATETDRIEFEMHKIELDQDLARFKLASENTERNLAVLLGFLTGAKIQTPTTVGHEHRDDLPNAPFNAEIHPLVSTGSLRSREATLKANQFGRWWVPSIDLYAGYGLHTFKERGYDPQAERFESVIGVQLTMDLFDSFIARTEIRQKELEAAGLRKESAQTARELEAKIEGARAELKLTHDLVHQSEDAIKRAKIYLARTLDEYRRGVKNSPDVLSALEKNLAMRRRFAELRRDYQLARSELLESLGQ